MKERMKKISGTVSQASPALRRRFSLKFDQPVRTKVPLWRKLTEGADLPGMINEIEKILLGKEDWVTGGEESMLLCALKGGNRAVINLLLGKEDQRTYKEKKRGFTVLHYAIECGDKETVIEFLKRGFLESGNILHYMDKEGFTPLHRAIQKGDKEIIGALADGSIVCATRVVPNWNVKGYKERTPAHYVTMSRSAMDIVKLLVRIKDINWNAQDVDGNTPLHCLFMNKKLAEIKFLLEFQENDQRLNIDVDLKNVEGESLRTLASAKTAPLTRRLLADSMKDSGDIAVASISSHKGSAEVRINGSAGYRASVSEQEPQTDESRISPRRYKTTGPSRLKICSSTTESGTSQRM